MDSFVLISIFSLAVIIHMILSLMSNEEIKKAPSGGYLRVMFWLARRSEWKLRLTAASFFAVLLSIVFLYVHYR